MGKIRLDIECPKCALVDYNQDIDYGKTTIWNCSMCDSEVHFYVNCYEKDADKHGNQG